MSNFLGFQVAKNRLSKIQVIYLLAFIVFFVVTSSASAAELWVDRNSLGGQCNDNRARNQVSQSAPWCTLAKAGTDVQSGDVVYVREGVYSETHHQHPLSWGAAVLQICVSGTKQSPIKFIAAPGENVVLNPSGGAIYGVIAAGGGGFTPQYVEINGFVIEGFPEVGIMVSESSDIVIKNVDLSGCVWGGISSQRAASLTIENCRIHDNYLTGWTSPISLWECEGENVVRGNHIWGNTDEDYRETEGHGIILDYCTASASALIENNVIWENEGWCMDIFNSDNATIRNNTCWKNSLGRYDGTGEISLWGRGHTVHNNLMVSRGDGPAMVIYEEGNNLPTIETSHNLMWSPSSSNVVSWPPWRTGSVSQFRSQNGYGWGSNSIQSNPLLVNPGAQNFKIPDTSPAIDAGSNALAAAKDCEGNDRPADGDGNGSAIVDLGAFEFGAGGSGEPGGQDIFNDDFESGFGGWTVVQG